MTKKITKRITSIFIMLVISQTVYSQTLFGVKAGLAESRPYYVDENKRELLSDYIRFKPGITGGAYLKRIFNTVLAVNIEILYTQKGLQYEQVGIVKGTNTMNYMEAPATGHILLSRTKYSFSEFYFGGFYGFWINGSYNKTDYATGETTSDKVDFSNTLYKYSRNDAGAVVGLAYSYNKLVFDLRYVHGFLGSAAETVDDLQSRCLYLTIGYRLIKQK